MSYHCVRRVVGLSVCLLALVHLVGAFPATSLRQPSAAASGATTLYMPIILNSALPSQSSNSIFGVEMTSVTPAAGLTAAAEAGATWVRRNALVWRDVEPNEDGGYNWGAVANLEQEMINASQNNLRMILIVRGSPDWATGTSSDCRPIRSDKYAKFANFLAAAVARYSQPPYNVKFWEIGNEPDAPVLYEYLFFGCWGNPADEYYGGREYGEMLKTVYPAMKAADPSVQVMNGGLLMDRPFNPDDGSGHMARFLEGMFVVGAGSSFDILQYHSYYFWQGTSPDGATTVGSAAVDWKVGYVRNLMNAYGVPEKPLLNGEGALLCGETATPECRQAQADAVGRLYARSIKDRLLAFVWYIFNDDSFFNSALIEPWNPSAKRPAYFAYKQAAAMLGGATYLGPLADQAPGVEGYRFSRGSETITIFWSDIPQGAAIPVEGAAVSCSDREGVPIGCSNDGGTVFLEASVSPKYVVAH